MTFVYMLDTDTVSFALRGVGNVGARILEHKPSQLCVSELTLAELRFGAEKRKSRKLHRLIETFVEDVVALPFDDAAAVVYGKLAATLKSRGTPVGSLDTLIAAHALAAKLTLVTNNARHFAKVAKLSHESWV